MTPCPPVSKNLSLRVRGAVGGRGPTATQPVARHPFLQAGAPAGPTANRTLS